ncbi:hypothetical protein [Nocardia sp. NPDC052566]|uniref:hypothetical protein n=1 Tax=Nocardia sp. NPDC052566 TaxID=3364330 RepID=UPI0037CAED07
MNQSAETVRILLSAAGLPTNAAEVRGLAALFPGFRAAVDALYAPPAVRYGDPAMRFHARARFEEWGR